MDRARIRWPITTGGVGAKDAAPYRADWHAEVTPYTLRHSSIAWQLLKGVPTRVVAAHHDTSVVMIERNYSRFIIGDPSEALTCAALLDVGAPQSSADVVPFARLAS